MISVIIPTYNRERTLLRSIESVLSQSYADLELIIVDDCSTDGTEELVRSIKDPRIRYIKLERNRGAAGARNKGIALSSGDYIAFNDSDDIWRPEKLEVQLAAMQGTGADVCIARMKRHGYDETSNPIVPSPDIDCGFIDRATILKGTIVSMQAVLAKKEVFDDVLFDEDIPWVEDAEWALRASNAHTFFLSDQVLVDVYLQNDSITIVNADKRRPYYEKVISFGDAFWGPAPKAYAQILEELAKIKTAEGEDASRLFMKAARIDPSVKRFAKAILAKMHLLNLRYRHL